MASTQVSSSRLENLPVSFFAMVMGLSGLTIAWEKAVSLGYLELPALPSALLFFTAGVFTLLAVLYTVKLIRHTASVASEFHHPVKLNFFPAISISLLLLAIAMLPVDRNTSMALWTMGTLWHLVLTLYVVNAWMHHEHFKVEHINPAWFIPAVGNVIVPLAGVPLGYPDISWFFFSVGLLFWGVLLTIVFYRLMFHAPMDSKLLPTLFILIAPPAVGFLSYIRLNGDVDAFARVLYYAGLFMTLVMFTQMPRFVRLRFSLAWWAYSFPLAAISIASMAMFERTGNQVLGLIAAGLLAAVTAMVIFLVVRTLRAVMAHGICVPEH